MTVNAQERATTDKHAHDSTVGVMHDKHNLTVPDEELFEKAYNSVYDTLDVEKSST